MTARDRTRSTPPPPGAPTTGSEAARLLNNYARGYSAGAFATPIASEMERIMAGGSDKAWYWWPSGTGGTAAVGRKLTRPARRRDFTGRPVPMPAGTRVLDHIVPGPAGVPRLDRWHWIWGYVEDRQLADAMQMQGRQVAGVRVSAASEIIACWGLPGTAHPYPAHDHATITQLPLDVSVYEREQIRGEIARFTEWTDDFPYYSDGTWGAISLRGFNPADPAWGIKPAEMSKNWWAEHPEAKQYDRCDWTVAAPRCPTIVNLVTAVVAPWGGELERVRLLRMAGNAGRGGRLARHTDITDRAAGTADGQIIRFHIPLVTDPRITMSGWNLAGEEHAVHLAEWGLYYLDARKPHAVHNAAGIDRIHLVIDVTATPAARAAIAAGTDHAAVRRAGLFTGTAPAAVPA
jgi:hypothetical protein